MADVALTTWNSGDQLNATDLNANFTELLKARTLTLTAGEAIDASTTPQCIYVKASDGKVYKTDADADESSYRFIGFVSGGQNVSINDSVRVVVQGLVEGFTGLTQNSFYFISATAGAITATQPSARAVRIGLAISTTQLFILTASMKVASFSDSLGAGTGTDVTHTVTTGFRLVAAFGISDSFATGGMWFANRYGTNYSYGYESSSYMASYYTDKIAVNLDADYNVRGVILQNITDTTFDLVYERHDTLSTPARSIYGFIIGE